MQRLYVLFLAAWLAVVSASAGAQVYVQGYPGGKATLVAQTTGTASAITAKATMGTIGTWASGYSVGTGGTATAPTNPGNAVGFPDSSYATVKATGTTTSTSSETITIPVSEIPTKGTRVLQIYYDYTTPGAAAVETLTATISNPGGTGDGTTVPLEHHTGTPFALTLTTIGTSLSVTFTHSGVAAATSTGSWLIDTAGVAVADYFSGQAADAGLFVAQGRQLVMDRLLGSGSNSLVGVGMGTGTTAPADSDTGLSGSGFVTAVDNGQAGQTAVPSRSGYVDTFTATVKPSSVYTFSEWAIYAGYVNGSSPLAARGLWSKPYTKTTNQSLVVTVTLTGS